MSLRPRRYHLRCLGVAAFVVLLGVLVIIDGRLKQSDRPGFVPADARWMLVMDDLPGFWSALHAGPVWGEVRPELLPWVRSVELRVYRMTGVRPTPRRVALWTGATAVFGGTEDAVGVSVRPGLLLRLILGAARVGRGSSSDGIHRYGDLYYGWRDGNLIASDDRAYVAAALDANAAQAAEASSPNTATLVSGPETIHRPVIDMTFRPDPGFPVTGRMHCGGVTPAEAAPRLVPPLPAHAFVSCGSSHNLLSVVRAASGIVPWRIPEDLAPFVHAAVGSLRDLHGMDFSIEEPIGDRALTALWAGVIVDALPLPVIALELERRAEDAHHPLQTLMTGVSPIEHEWSGNEGLIVPLLGSALTVGLAARESMWVAASTEPLTAEMMALLAPPPADQGAEFVAVVSWPAIAASFRDVGQQWAEYEAIKGMNAASVRREVNRLADIFSKLGDTRIEGVFGERHLEFRGQLAAGSEPV